MIVVVDYGVGNLMSIANMFRRIGATAAISSKAEDIGSATALVLPGIGAFDSVMRSFDASGLRDILTRRVLEDRVPLLGICVGMQILGRHSEEGRLPGLGWVDAEFRRFRPQSGSSEPPLRVPHMGWSQVSRSSDHPLVRDLPPSSRFYFVHSYYAVCADPEDAVLTASYGIEFVAAFAHRNVMGVQFHPEKSHRFGMQLLKSFAEM